MQNRIGSFVSYLCPSDSDLLTSCDIDSNPIPLLLVHPSPSSSNMQPAKAPRGVADHQFALKIWLQGGANTTYLDYDTEWADKISSYKYKEDK